MNFWQLSKYKRGITYVVAPYLFLVLCHLITIGLFSVPWVSPDENIYLCHARFFAGLPHCYFQGLPYSNFGYGLFIAPVFWLAQDPETIYKLVILFNAFLLSTLYVIIFFILKKIFNKDDKTALLLSLLASFVPGIFVRANMAVVENIFTPLFYLSTLLFFLLIKKINYYRAILFSFTIILLYATHYRALPILFIALFSLLFLFLRSKYNKPAFLGVVLLIVGFIMVNQVNQYLMSVAWSEPIKYSFSRLLPNGFLLEKLTLIFSALAGQFLYLLAASFGLILYVLVHLFNSFKSIYQEKKIHKNINVFIVYFILVCLSVFASSASMVATTINFSQLRADHFIYGRYNDLLLPLILILGLEGLKKYQAISIKKLLILYLSLVIVLLLGARDFILHSLYATVNIVSIFYIIFFGPVTLGLLVLFVVVVFFYLLSKIEKLHLRVLLIFLLFIFNIICYVQFVLFVNSKATSYQKQIIPVLKNSGVKSISFDFRADAHNADDILISGSYLNKAYFITQYYLPYVDVHALSSAEQNQIDSDAFISYCSWSRSDYYLKEKVTSYYSLSGTRESCIALWLRK